MASLKHSVLLVALKRESSPAPTEIVSETEGGPSMFSGAQEHDTDLESSGDESDEIPALDDDFDPPSVLALLRGEVPSSV